jgi:excisionase family DNA binding protein
MSRNINQKQVSVLGKDKFVYTNDEVCELLRVTKKTLQKWRDEGRIGFSQVKSGGKVWYTKNHIEEFLKQHEIAANTFYSNGKKVS